MSASAGASRYGIPSAMRQTPHGYFLLSELHLRLTTTMSRPPRPPAATASLGARPVAPLTAVPRPITPVVRPGTPVMPPPHPGAAARPVPVVNAVPVPASTPGGQSLGEFVITCYDLEGTTASGASTSLATVAVDPSVIPLGTTINIQGVGTRVAQDTGGAILGHRLDLWEPSYAACMDWGVQSRQVSLEG